MKRINQRINCTEKNVKFKSGKRVKVFRSTRNRLVEPSKGQIKFVESKFEFP